MSKQVHAKRAKSMKMYGYNNGAGKAKKAADMERMAEYARGNFDFDVINGFKLVEKEYKTPKKTKREETREDFKKNVRPAFLKHIAETHADDLRKLGISEASIAHMKKGMSPNGFNVHHKQPIHGGGTNDFSNLIFMPIKPHDELHNLVINPQIQGKNIKEGVKIKMPWSDAMVWQRPERSRENTQSRPAVNPVLTAALKQNAARR